MNVNTSSILTLKDGLKIEVLPAEESKSLQTKAGVNNQLIAIMVKCDTHSIGPIFVEPEHLQSLVVGIPNS